MITAEEAHKRTIANMGSDRELLQRVIDEEISRLSAALEEHLNSGKTQTWLDFTPIWNTFSEEGPIYNPRQKFWLEKRFNQVLHTSGYTIQRKKQGRRQFGVPMEVNISWKKTRITSDHRRDW